MKTITQPAVVVIFIIIVMAIAILAYLATRDDEMLEWYRDQTLSSSIPKEYGFRVTKQIVAFPGDTEAQECPVLAGIVKGGKADRMGFKEGDIPLRLSSCEGPILPKGTFLYILSCRLVGKDAFIMVVNKSDVKPGWRDSVRKVLLAPQ